MLSQNPSRSIRPIGYGGGLLFGLLLLSGLLVPQTGDLEAQVDTTGDPMRPVTTFPRKPLSPLGDPFPYALYEHSILFDSTGGDIRLREELLGMPFGQTRTLTLDEYIRQRQAETRRRLWEERAREYTFYAPDDERSDTLTAEAMLDSILSGGSPSFTIPLPQNPITTLFGPPTIDINVNGNVNLSAGWQIDNNNLTSISTLGSTQSAPFFDQNIQVAVTGKIGNKLKLSTDFDTQRAFDIDNQMKISFGGGPESDDAILQLVEAGNVALESPSTLIGGSQTLFGVKTRTKFGKLTLTNILSQKRGERRVIKVSGGAVTNTICLKPFEYAQNHFWLDTVYKGFYDVFFRSTPPAATPQMAPFKITEIEVYEQVKDGAIPSQFDAVAYADLDGLATGLRYADAIRTPSTSLGSGAVQRGSFVAMERGRDYRLDEQLGTISIRSLQRDKAYAVAYRTADGRMHGELANTRSDNGQTAVLKLIYVNNMQPGFTTLWNRQMKNVYQLQGVRNVDLESSDIRITFGVPPDTSEVLPVAGGRRIMTILGVDRVNTSNQATPDGKFDIRNNRFFDTETGEIRFPAAEPFRGPLRDSLGAAAEPFVLDAIYDQTRDEAERDTRVGKYSICGEIAGAGGTSIPLGAFGVPANSVQVYKNGEPLVNGVDYRVDAIVGRVTLISSKATQGSGDLEIEFEQNDLFTTSVKTLVGMRADYALYNKRRVRSGLGLTFMRYGESTSADKVQIITGEEPTLNTGIGFDGYVNYEAPFLTDFINAIPGLSTEAPSELKLSGEIAAMIPEAKTQEELIDIDRDQAVTYIDDFESGGAQRQIQLGINYTLWSHASAPIDEDLGGNDSARVAHKGKTWWYNVSPSQTEVREIWPNRDTRGIAPATVLDFLFEPSERGIYNENVGYEAAPPLDMAWGAMMRSLSFFTTNLNEENIDFIEITLNAAQFEQGQTKVYLELGQISEDVIPNFDLNTEDGTTPENPQQDDVLNEGEDIGIDGLTNEGEQAFYMIGDSDPAKDDYSFDSFRSVNPDDYRKVNGLEGNVGQERGPFPDSEDLNDNRSIDLDNSYFRYEIDLNPDPATNPQIVGSGTGNWRQYRIPLRSGFSTVGTPSFSNVQYARIVVESPTRTHIRFAEMNLVGSEWRNIDIPVGDSTIDPKLEISFVNFEENADAPDFYTLPPGLRRAVNRTTDILENEQSLSLDVTNLERGESRGAIRVRPRPFDAFNYETMRFFLHGSDELDDALVPGREPKVVAWIRFGWDSLNYYEYRVPLLAGWNPYEIDFDDIAALKQEAVDPTTLSVFPIADRPGHSYALRGNPSLTRVQFVAFGIENRAWPGGLNSSMWINELRAVGSKGGTDWAARVSASARLADFGTINYNASRTNPDFHRLEERFGDRVERTNWAFNSVFQLDKFLPESMSGSSLPVSYSHTERIADPRYIAESDVEVERAVDRIRGDVSLPEDLASRRADSLERSVETLVVTDALAFSDIRLAFGGSSWPIRDIVNKLSFGFAYDQERERSPLYEERFRWQWDFRGGYGTRIPKNFTIKPFSSFLDSVPVLDFWKDFEINLLPTDIGASVQLHRERTTEKLRRLEFASPVVRDFRADRSANFNWPLLTGGVINPQVDYNLTTRSSLIDIETDDAGRQRTGGEIAERLFFDEGRLFQFGRDSRSTQTFTFNARPRIPFIPAAERLFRPTASYRVEYNWEDLLIEPTGEGSYAKSASWNSTGRLGMTIFLKQLGDIMFGDQPLRGPRRRPDTTESRSAISTILRTLIKAPIFDWDQVQLNFTQNNASKAPGVVGGTGVSNLWGRSLLFRSESPDFGPGAAYQLGLTRFPHGTVELPIFGGENSSGVRAPGINVNDNYSQENTLTANTSRQLLPGMTLTLSWNTAFGINQNYTVIDANADGLPQYQDVVTTGNLRRSFLSLPFFDNDIQAVVDEYGIRKGALIEPIDPGAGATQAEQDAYNRALTSYNREITETLSDVFEEKLEAFSLFDGSAADFLPSANWRLQWSGLHNLPFIKPWAQRASLSHEYRGEYVRNFRETDDGRVPETQTVSRGFQPLIGINITGNQDFWKGTATATINYNTTSEFALVTASRSEISKQLRNELQVQLGYLRRGLKMSFLGLDLKNEIEFTVDFSLARENTKRFNLTEFRPEGNNDGSTRISFRPAVRYTVSRTVDATGFVSYEATIPDEEGSRDISRSTLKVGVDLRLKISGGR